MRSNPVIKRIRPAVTKPVVEGEWRDLSAAVQVELTSEDPDRPIEGALMLDRTSGWRAATPGPQTISLVFSTPTSLRRIRLVFEEQSRGRTQEFVLRASTRDGDRQIVRQQFTFSPPTTTVEREEYAVDLDDTTGLELVIVPAIDDANAIATLKEWRAA
jgi:hypothetical protein